MQSPALNFTPRGLYIGGQWVSPADGGSFTSINPANMEKLADVPSAGETDVDAAVQAAKAGFKEWSRVPIKERARCLELLADRIEQNADELALFDAVDFGQRNRRHARRHDLDRGLAALLRRPGDGDQGRDVLAGRSPPQSHPPATVRRRGQDQPIQSPFPLLRGEGRRTARGRQHGRDKRVGAGAAFKPAPGRVV